MRVVNANEIDHTPLGPSQGGGGTGLRYRGSNFFFFGQVRPPNDLHLPNSVCFAEKRNVLNSYIYHLRTELRHAPNWATPCLTCEATVPHKKDESPVSWENGRVSADHPV